MTTDVTALPEGRALRITRSISTTVGPCGLATFGFALWYYGSSENIFTFLGWGTLDILIGLSLLKHGSTKDAMLPLGYGSIACGVVIVIYNNGQATWGIDETICALGAVISLIGWYKGGPVYGAVLGAFTMGIAGIPIVVDNYYEPHHWEWWLWVCSYVSSTLGLYLNWPWKRENIADWSFVAVSQIFGTVMLLILALR